MPTETPQIAKVGARVLVIAGFAPSLINFRGPLLRALRSLGCDVHACAPQIDPRTREQLEGIGVSAHTIPLNRTGMNPFADFRSALCLYRVMRKLKPTIVLSYTIKPVILGSIAARAAGVARIYSLITGLGFAFLGENSKQRLAGSIAKPLYRLALRTNKAVIFQNPDDHRLFVSAGLLGSEAKTTVVNGSGVDLASFCTTTPISEPVIFLLIARLYREKGITEFIEAARIVKTRYPHCKFKILGPFDSNPSAYGPADVAGWVSDGAVEYLGATDDVRPHLAACSVYVLPSYREGTPRSVLEAMATGRAIITTDTAGCRETIRLLEDDYDHKSLLRRGENGYLVPVKNVGALATAMCCFVEHRSLIAEMGSNSRKIAEQKFDVKKVNCDMLTAMELN